jgi:hypothetical protein
LLGNQQAAALPLICCITVKNAVSLPAPLPWGSRLVQMHEPSLFYGALRIDTTMAEAACIGFLLLGRHERPQ